VDSGEGAGEHETSALFSNQITLQKRHRQTRRLFTSCLVALFLRGRSCPLCYRSVRNEPDCCVTWGRGQGQGEDEDDNAEMRQTANQRSNSWCKDLTLLPISRRGTVNRSPSDGERVQRPIQGRSGPHCSPVVSPRFPPFLVVLCRFSSVPPSIRVDFRLFAAFVE